MVPCPFVKSCPFYRRYQVDPVWAHLIREYCHGNLQTYCRIGTYLEQTGQIPPASWTPVGQVSEGAGKP